MKKNIVKKKDLFLTFIAITGLSVITIAQNFQWAKAMGSGGYDSGASITLDASGNLYTTGGFEGTVDFDPGSGTFNMTSGSLQNYNMFISKLDPSGNFVWAKRMGGTDNTFGSSITIDASGNIYTTGSFAGTADFDPGPATFNLTSGVGSGFISKLDASGNFVWAKSVGGVQIVVDASGDVYTTGTYNGTRDFDPSAGVFNMTSAGSEDIYILKLNSSGNFVWAKGMGGPSQDFGNSIAIDASGNIYTTGFFRETVDFDPGPGSYTMYSGSLPNAFISKLDANGNFVWAKGMIGWSSTANSIAIDASNNIYTTGDFNGIVDFDPGVGTNNLSSYGGGDLFISKLDAFGNFVWAKSVSNTNGLQCNSIAFDNTGSVYTSGWFNYGTTDFDPGSAIYNLTSNGSIDVFILKLDISGNFTWAKAIGGIGVDRGFDIAVDASNNVYTTGIFENTADFDPSIATFNMNSGGGADIFILKLCTPPPPVGLIDGPSSICVGATATYSISAISGASAYFWTVPSGTIINSGQSTTSINVTFGSTSGNIEVSLSNCCVCAPPNPLAVIIIPKPVIGATASPSLTICTGSTISLSGTGAQTYTWNNGVVDGQSFIPLYSSNYYTVTGTDTNGCVNTYNVSVTVSPLPIVSAVVSPSSTICEGSSVTLNGSGATNYSWDNGVSNGVPFIVNSTTTYTVLGTTANGCTDTHSVTINVIPRPIVGITTFPSLSICEGSSITLNGTGALTYSWSNGINNGIPFSPSLTTVYTVTGIDTNGCTSNPIPVNVVVYPLPIITADIMLANYGNNSVNITVDNGFPPYTYDWSMDGTGDFDDSQNQTGLSGGDYILTVSDQYGCKDTIRVSIENGDELFVTTGISPNGDGLNDVWAILGTNQFEDLKVSVFNLIGQCVYNQQEKYIPWDGLYNGVLAPVGDYYYVIESIIKKKKLTGTLTVKY